MKDYLIVAYDGNIRINDIPNCIKEDKIIEIARVILMQNNNKPIIQLCNVTVYKNSEIYNHLEKKFGDYIDGNYYTSYDYQDVKEL